MVVKRMDNVGIVVENLDAAVAFFQALGLSLAYALTVLVVAGLGGLVQLVGGTPGDAS